MAVYLAPTRTSRAMPVDLRREGDQYILDADLPGVDPKSVDLDVAGRVLTISAERPSRDTASSTWLTGERPTGAFRRQFTLGSGVDSDGISAKYNNGVLSVVIPVSEKSKPRKVEISTDSAAVDEPSTEETAETAEVAAA